MITKLKSIEKPHIIFAETFEPEAIEQFKNVMAQDSVIQGAIMPDVHCGYTLPIGGVVKTQDIVYASFVGFDIGCGVCAQKTTFNVKDVFEKRYDIKDELEKVIPLGFKHNKRSQTWRAFKDLPKSDWFNKMFWDKGGLKQLGTLGGGNHYIEIGSDENNSIWLMIHSGSRGIGHKTASYYMAKAHPEGKAKEGAYGFDIGTQIGKSYFTDQNICLEFALENRVQMISKIIDVMNNHCQGEKDDMFINRTHNHAEYIGDGRIIHRKGATHAEKGMYGVIPGNRRDGSFIVVGKGNVESMCSSSHGAGRVLSRKKAKKAFDVETERKGLGDIAATVNEGNLDESPGAYKNIFDVMRIQEEQGLVEVKHHVVPIINIKG